LSTLAYDIPKNHGAFGPIEVIAPEGTVVNVRSPGPVSLNTTSGGATVKYLTSAVLMQMLATSEKWRGEVMARNSGGRGVRHAGVNQKGIYYVSILTDVSGNGATSCHDGVDSGGNRMTAPNIEWREMNFPLLYLFRRHLKDGMGAGKFRGGAGTERAVLLHDAPEGKIRGVAMGAAGLRNSGKGAFGGYPGAPSILVLSKNAKARDLRADNILPQTLEDLGGEATVLPYCDFDLRDGAALYMRGESGGGYGDPLERDPQLVMWDVTEGLVSPDVARDVYGVMINGERCELDREATQRFRAILREKRLIPQ
jgi:N-methylhydantoinase B